MARGRSLQAAFEPILHALVGLMDTPVVALRSKALRGIGNIVTVDPDVLGMVSFMLELGLISSLLSAKLSRTACLIALRLSAMPLSSWWGSTS